MAKLNRVKTQKSPRRMELWEVPANLYDRNARFEIDDQVKALLHGGRVRLSDRWVEDIPGAIMLARRALEVAILEAQSRAEDDLGPMIDRWEIVSDAARGAHKATRKLMGALTDKGPPHHYLHLVRGLRTAKVFTGSLTERLDASIHAAQTFFQIADLMGQIADVAQRQRREISNSRKNAGDPAARGFVQMLAETWVVLTNRPPGSHEAESANPFLRFLIAAWKDAGGTVSDAGGEGTAFKRMMQAACRSLDPERVQDIQHRGLDAIDWK